jgi:Cu-Zn family superoxide dismutase
MVQQNGESPMQNNAICVSSLALALLACAPTSPTLESQRARLADGAKVEVRDTKGHTVGTLTVSLQSGGGVRFNGRLTDLPGGVHGVHVHEKGKCDPPDFESAGPDLSLSGKEHGLHNPQGSHEGDIGNLRIDPSGSAEVSLMAEKVTLLGGTNSLLRPGGTSLVIHESPDDLKTDPSGNSGARIACGVITR